MGTVSVIKKGKESQSRVSENAPPARGCAGRAPRPQRHLLGFVPSTPGGGFPQRPFCARRNHGPQTTCLRAALSFLRALARSLAHWGSDRAAGSRPVAKPCPGSPQSKLGGGGETSGRQRGPPVSPAVPGLLGLRGGDGEGPGPGCTDSCGGESLQNSSPAERGETWLK